MFAKKNIYIALVIVIVLGAFLRFYKLGNNSFVADEFLDINSSFAYAKTGVWQNWDFNLGEINIDNEFQARDARAWVYKWPVAMLFRFLSPTEEVARSISAIWGILSIILIYFVATYFTKKKTIGLISAFLFAISISGIEYDRKLRMYAMFLPVYLVFSWLLFRFLEDKYEGKIGFLRGVNEKWGINLVYLIPAILVGILSLLTHQLTANIAFVVGFYLLFWAILEKKKNKSCLNKYSVFLGLGLFGIIAAFLAIPNVVAPFTAGLTFFTEHSQYLRISLEDYTNVILALIFIFLGIYFIYKKQNMTKEGSFLAISFFVPLLSAMFLWSRNVGNQYIFFLKSFSLILLASGIYFAAEFFKNNLKNNGKKAFLATIVLSLLILPNYGYFFETSDNTYNQTSSSSNPNYRKIFTYFKKAKNDGDVLITRNFRNYYFSGAKVKVFDFGGELTKEKFSLADLQNIINQNPTGWFIISKNDETYITGETIDYIEKNLERVSNPHVRGDVLVYRWGN